MGDCVLFLLPTSESKLLTQWRGPFEVVRWVGTMNYEVCQLEKREATQIHPVNLLKVWKEQDVIPFPPELSPQAMMAPHPDTVTIG